MPTLVPPRPTNDIYDSRAHQRACLAVFQNNTSCTAVLVLPAVHVHAHALVAFATLLFR